MTAFDQLGELEPPEPMMFREAVDYYRHKGVLPTWLTHDEMAEILPQIRERALWSAQVQDAEMLEGIAAELDDLIATGLEPALGGPESEIDLPGSPRQRLVELADNLGVDALTSEARMSLILRTQSDMAYGYGDFKQATSRGALDAFPCWELKRAEWRMKPRQSSDGVADRYWSEQWEKNGGEFYGEEGRMIARKDDEIWVAISQFGLPHDPLAFNTGYRRFDVPYQECVALGVIEPDETVETPDDPAFAPDKADPDLEPAVKSADLRAVMEDAGYEFDEGGALTALAE